MTGLDFFSALLDATSLVFGIFGLVLVFLARDIDDWPKGLSIAALSSVIARSMFELTDPLIANAGLSPALTFAFRNLEVVVAQLPILLMFAYFLYCCGEDYRESAVMRVQIALALAISVTVFAAQLTSEISIVPGTHAHPGPWTVLFLSLDLAASLICLAALFRRRRKLSRVQRAMFCVMFLLFLFSMSTMGIVLVELVLSGDLVNRYLEQKKETARQQARIAVLQMRPHFIYNTLTSIYYLCARDPKEAQQTILDFTRYLQDNFNAIVEDGPVPFTKELEHTRAYVAVEQACHMDRLFVEFDTPVTAFRIPPLTLQPIVENAIKHGMDPDSDPLRVCVSTRVTGSVVEVTVADNGCGYRLPEDGRPAIALDNIRERLKAQCAGTLTIEDKEGGGTLVTISIPWDNPDNATR